MICKIYREIKLVGLLDWMWFVIYLKRDELSDKLSIDNYQYQHPKRSFKDTLASDKMLKDRLRAHTIAQKLTNNDFRL